MTGAFNCFINPFSMHVHVKLIIKFIWHTASCMCLILCPFSSMYSGGGPQGNSPKVLHLLFPHLQCVIILMKVSTWGSSTCFPASGDVEESGSPCAINPSSASGSLQLWGLGVQLLLSQVSQATQSPLGVQMPVEPQPCSGWPQQSWYHPPSCSCSLAELTVFLLEVDSSSLSVRESSANSLTSPILSSHGSFDSPNGNIVQHFDGGGFLHH